MSGMSKAVTRLIDQFTPENYNLSLHPDKDTMTFAGTITITGKKIGRPAKRITFHQKDLKVQSAKIKKLGKQPAEIEVSRINTHNSFDELRLHTDNLIYPGIYEVTIEFSGVITPQMNGLYPCTFTHNDQEKFLLATQFESHHAREVFPCIDEPAAKATFDVTLTSPKHETVLSNTPVKKQHERDGNLVTQFETTPIMSSYLLAFVIGELKHKQKTTKQGVVVRAFATPDNVEFTDFGLDVAVKSLEFYHDYFGIDYPLAKSDMVALPDFASGAMENWGLVTYREHCMLVDPKNTSLPTKQYVAMVVAHELAHQWFGNLVTMRWWTDLWLNEGFASWIEYMAVDALFPEWRMWTQFIVDEQQSALKLDALDNTHAIEAPINHPDEIRTIFDAISYNKGASVIHMLHEYLGPTAFRDGLRYYLQKHQYGNTDTVDLWSALEEISKKPVTAFMEQWTTQPGFPLVDADVAANSITVSQQRFHYVNQGQTHKTLWPIALKGNEALKDAILEDTEQTWPEHDNTTVFKLNAGQSGFYRVHYNSSHLQKLSEAIEAGRFDTLDRLGILSDAFETAKAGHGDTADVLKLLESYSKESEAPVWDVISGVIGSIRGVMDNETLREDMQPYIRELIQPQLDRLGWTQQKDENYFDQLLRPTILGMASVAEEPAVIAHAQKLFASMKKAEDISPDVRSVVYNTVARHGDAETFKQLVALHNGSSSSEERTMLAAAITGFQQPTLIKKSLAMITTDKVRNQDVGYWVAYAFMNRHGKEIAWEWLKTNWQWLTDNLGTDLSFGRFPIYAARCFSDKTFLKEYQKFFKPILTPALERAYKQGAEIVEWQADWKTRDFKTVAHFFATRK